MIPRIIHYCWFGDKPIPQSQVAYIAHWRELLPDYQFVLWDNASLDKFKDVAWVREAIDAGFYAFAADYVRYYAVYEQGGIYLDTDVELLKPFDDLLDRPYLMGVEYADYPESGIFGAEPHSDLIRWCKEFYESHHFTPDQQTLTTCKAPQVMHDSIIKHHTFIVSQEHPSLHPEAISLLPSDYLTAMSADTGIAHPTSNTYTIHHFAGSWCYKSIGSRLRRSMKIQASQILGERIVRKIRNLFS